MSAVLTRGIADQHANAPTYAPEVTTTAREIGRESVLQDQGRFADWLACEEGRCASSYYGPISTWELVQILFNLGSTEDQRFAACALLRDRYLADQQEQVMKVATAAMEG